MMENRFYWLPQLLLLLLLKGYVTLGQNSTFSPLQQTTLASPPSTGYYDPKMTSSTTDDDLDIILRGVSTYKRSLTFGFVQLTGSSAFPILVGKLDDTVNAPIVAGARFGQGRLILGTHTAYLGPSPEADGSDNDRLLLNQIEWLAAKNRKKSIGLYQSSDELEEFLTQNSYTVTTLRKAELTATDDSLSRKYSVICIGTSSPIYKNHGVTAGLQNFVKNGGGGLFIVNTPWAWSIQDIKLANKLVAPAGLIWQGGDESYAAATTATSNVYNASRALLQNTHAAQLWTGINLVLRGAPEPPSFVTKNAVGYMKLVDAAIESSPKSDQAPFLKTVKSDMTSLDLTSVIPSVKNPAKKLMDRLNLLIHYTMTTQFLTPDQIKAHPAADIFPGKILNSDATSSSSSSHSRHEENMTHVIFLNLTRHHQQQQQQQQQNKNEEPPTQKWWEIRTDLHKNWREPSAGEIQQMISQDIVVEPRIKDWHSTGLYAPAGQVITLKFKNGDGASLSGYQVLIGSHTDDLRKLDSWDRCPRLTLQKPVVDNEERSLKMASPFGGLIYIIVPSDADPKGSTLTVTVEGAIRAPRFVLGQTTVQEWQDTIKKFNGPWAEFESTKIILTVPTPDARQVNDPDQLMKFWDQVMNEFADLTDLSLDRPQPYRMVSDIQISAGFMHSGYPIMTGLPEAKDTISLKSLKSADGWGQYHEVGHNHQVSAWTWEGLTEVTNNLMVLYIYDHLLKINYDTVRESLYPSNQAREAKKYVKGGKKFSVWKDDPWLALGSYIQLQKRFGWDLFKKVFKQYHQLTNAEKNLGDDGLRDLWVVMVSKEAGENLTPFYRSWGIPISEQADIKLGDLPLTNLSINDLFK